jgi:signal transduction histidine kinase
MISRPTERRGFPGGLRAQLLLGLCLLVALGFLLGAGLALIPRDGTVSEAAARELVFAFLGLEILVLLLLGYGFFTFLVVRPIRAIGVASERAARGNLASPIKRFPRNEFGQVSRQFNQMLVELRKNREELEERLRLLDRANRELRETRDSLIRSEKLAGVGQLAAGVAHEVGNPLAAILGYLELLSDDDLDPDTRRDVLSRSRREVERIRSTVRNLLDYSREDSEASAEPVDLARCVDEAVHLVRAQPKAKGVAIACAIPDDLAKARAVGSEVVQVLVNLLINAVDALSDAAGEDAQITISADSSEPDQLVLRIRDNGPGIPAEARRRVFDPFFTTKDPGEGTGLGLAICLRLMRRHGGDIRLHDAPGPGAAFELVFERADQG